MSILIQKFGGTSVSTEKNRAHVIAHIQEAVQNHHKLVVVVSAMGRYPEPYATDSLMNLIQKEQSNCSPRELDLLISCGETISSVVLAHELRANQVTATALTGAQAGIRTSSDFTKAKIKKIKPARVLKELRHHDVVVVAGFQGMAETGDITTIGRGGSDTTAAALGSALKAERVDIYTDVNGIMTADPSIVTSAKPLLNATYLEICHMAYQGASIVHPRAVELLMQANIPLRIASTYTKDKGTHISSTQPSDPFSERLERPVTGIAHMKGLTQIKVNTKGQSYHVQSEVFKAMASEGISVDFINISTSGVSYTVPDPLTELALQALKKRHFTVSAMRDCAKVSVVGAGMAGMPGVASTMIQALTDKGIRILQSADSHTTIWALVSGADVNMAVNALHDVFKLGLPVSEKN
ncbi:Aspartate kinase [Lentibacillus sp. JNUCC-1]|uniref:aspartate kinase n=1 Tax=Lentibacillus sp. JNUCC-1 TaxID=2654513 RepID=UPI0012E832E7|nr:aspartate kinase [Lentibacillus sp. JNUCC-1]MUV39906.1 Aspartate kinase [Lentibacillus sp. JNUCC-1]